MTELILIGKVVSLFFAIMHVVAVVGNIKVGRPIDRPEMLLMSASVTAFVTLQWLI